jgi:hypothetical protein
MRTVQRLADPLCDFAQAQHPLRLDDLPLGMQPLGLHRVEPGTLARQQAGRQQHALPAALDLLVVGAHRVAHQAAGMPAGVIPEEHQPGDVGLGGGLFSTPDQVLDGDRALSGRPSTKRSQVWACSGSHSP